LFHAALRGVCCSQYLFRVLTPHDLGTSSNALAILVKHFKQTNKKANKKKKKKRKEKDKKTSTKNT